MAHLDWHVHQVDIVAAYLNADLDDEVYMEAPHGILKPRSQDLICRLQKGLYGLKQASRGWYLKLCGDLEEIGFKPSKTDASVFHRDSPKGKIIVPVSMDDMVIAGSTLKAIEVFKNELREMYGVTNLGEIRWLLGFKIRRDRKARTIGINQATYLKNVAEKFCIADAKPVYIPMEGGLILADGDGSNAINAPYQAACGSILWAVIISRPDIQFTVGILAQHTQNPTEVHWKALKRVI